VRTLSAQRILLRKRDEELLPADRLHDELLAAQIADLAVAGFLTGAEREPAQRLVDRADRLVLLLLRDQLRDGERDRDRLWQSVKAAPSPSRPAPSTFRPLSRCP
jgi:hypothetical protein